MEAKVGGRDREAELRAVREIVPVSRKDEAEEGTDSQGVGVSREPKRMFSPRQSLMASCHCLLSSAVQPRHAKATRNGTRASKPSRRMAFPLESNFALLASGYSPASAPTQAGFALRPSLKRKRSVFAYASGSEYARQSSQSDLKKRSATERYQT